MNYQDNGISYKIHRLPISAGTGAVSPAGAGRFCPCGSAVNRPHPGGAGCRPAAWPWSVPSGNRLRL